MIIKFFTSRIDKSNKKTMPNLVSGFTSTPNFVSLRGVLDGFSNKFKYIKKLFFKNFNNSTTKTQHKTWCRGFTLIELLVVVTILGVISGIVVSSVSKARMKSRDATRLLNMSQIQMALEIYRFRTGQYPSSDGLGSGGWDTPGPGGAEITGSFLTALVDGKYVAQHFQDPTTNTTNGNYRYYRYPSGYGCTEPYYVLGVLDMETSGNPYPKSPGWNCPTRNWQSEMEWVTGGFE